MASIQTIEEQIVSEYGVILGFIKNNAVPCVIAALFVGGFIDRFF